MFSHFYHFHCKLHRITVTYYIIDRKVYKFTILLCFYRCHCCLLLSLWLNLNRPLYLLLLYLCLGHLLHLCPGFLCLCLRYFFLTMSAISMLASLVPWPGLCALFASVVSVAGLNAWVAYSVYICYVYTWFLGFIYICYICVWFDYSVYVYFAYSLFVPMLWLFVF